MTFTSNISKSIKVLGGEIPMEKEKETPVESATTEKTQTAVATSEVEKEKYTLMKKSIL